MLQLGPSGWAQSPPTAEAHETRSRRPAPGTPRLDIPGSWTDNGSSHGRRGGRHGGTDNGPVFLPHAFLQPLSARALRGRLNRQKHSGAPDGSPVALPSAQAEVGGPLITPSLPPRGRTMLLFHEGFRPLLSSSSDEASGERDSVPTPLSFSTTSSLHPPGAGRTGRGRSSPPGRRSHSQKRLSRQGRSLSISAITSALTAAYLLLPRRQPFVTR